MITWKKWLDWAFLQLKNSLSPRRDSEIILEIVTKKSREQLLTFEETTLTPEQIKKLQSLIDRRKKSEPIAYLVGSKEFWSLSFKISPGVFIPRTDTECLIEEVLNLIPDCNHLKVLDLGSGVGSIALALASERPTWNITGIDQQQQAVILAIKNQKSYKFRNVEFKQSNWFTKIKKNKFHLIVSNPPYINEHDLHFLSQDIHFEPKSALVSPYYGLKDLIIICKQSINHLYPMGWLCLEHGWNQGKYIRTLLHAIGFNNIHTILDYHQYERITCGQWKYYS
ncbi:methylase of polypeptide chain release factors [Candidatus Blochmanniella floridana]|uniref:Release factor glutamine methyltransferase n=1 Tax=Blochmanniella floridana TaxID=203907 RepID=Q7VR73_BLOFL|nr:methylase of polypeptide chain release factors [Candidatus Blochmannia floridanus]